MTVNIAGDVVALPDFDAWPTQTPARRVTCTSSWRLHRAPPRVQLRSLGEPALPCPLHVAARRLAASSVSGCCLPNVLGKHPLADFKHPHEQLFGARVRSPPTPLAGPAGRLRQATAHNYSSWTRNGFVDD